MWHHGNMLRKTLLALLWFPFTLILLLINLTLLESSAFWSQPALPLSNVAPDQNSVTAAGGTSEVLSANVIAGDARTMREGVEILRVELPDGASSYKYSNKRYHVIFGWWANPIPNGRGCSRAR